MASTANRSLVERMVGFARMLRDNGFSTGPDQVADALTALTAVDLSRPSQMRMALRPLFASRRDEAHRFAELFDAYWLRRGIRQATIAPQPTRIEGANRVATSSDIRAAHAGLVERIERADDTLPADHAPSNAQSAGASRQETLNRTDFRFLADDATKAEVERLAEVLANTMRRRLRRRQKVARRGDRFDLRRMLRASIAHGGEPIEVFRRRPLRKPLRPVLLLDASGSMSQYSGVFLRFMLAFLKRLPYGEGFFFHTRLVEIAPVVRERRADRVMDRLSLLAEGWGGGTKIGECLELFARHHAKRALRGRSLLFVLSDGYDTGEPERLARAIQSLAKRTRRVIWLNPLLGWRDYQPSAAGMAAALPHVDLFAPAHNLESLAALEPHLARV